MPHSQKPNSRAPRVGVYGSCVGRDSVDLLLERGWELSTYIPRQSLVSAVAPAPPDTLPLSGISSAFVQRVLRGDIRGDMYERLTQEAQTTDVLLWDLIDERLGFFDLPDGGVVTRTMEGLGEDLYTHLAGARLVEFGTTEHLQRWKEHLSVFTGFLKEQGLWERTLLLLCPWALTDSTGQPTPTSWGTTPLEGNWLFTEYYATAASTGLTVIRLPDELSVAGDTHKWGPAPFHYIDAAYEWVADAVNNFLTSRSAAPPPELVWQGHPPS